MSNKIIGIYAIKNTVNGKQYIGSSISVKHRWNQSHRPLLRKNKHCNPHLQNSWNKHKENAFEFCILEECNKLDLIHREEYWINYYKSWKRNFGYNLIRFVNGRPIISEERRKEYYSQGIHPKIKTLYLAGKSKNAIAKELKLNRNVIYHSLEQQNLHKNTGKGSLVKLTNKTKKQIKKMRDKKLTWDEISKKTQISHTQLFRACEHTKDNAYGGEQNIRKTYKVMTPEIEKEAIELRGQGLKWKDVAKKLDVHLTLFYRYGIAQKHKNIVRTTMTKEIKELIIEMKKQGKTWKEISHETKCSLTNIYRHGLNQLI